MDDKISIVVTVYNSEKYIEKCLKSIKEQTYKNLEIVIVNDGSTDKSKNIIEKICKDDNRFILINQRNMGVASAKNKGMDEASGKYIIFIDSDDWIDKDLIEIMKNAADKENLDIIFCNYKKEKENGKLIKVGILNKYIQNYTNKEILAMHIAGLVPCGASHKMIKKEILDKWRVRFSDLVRGEELEYSIKAILRAKNIGYVTKTYYHYIERKHSLSKCENYSFMPNIECLKNVLEKEKIMDEYEKYYNLAILNYFVIEIYNSLKQGKITDSKKISNKIVDRYRKILVYNNIDMEYCTKRTKVLSKLINMQCYRNCFNY